MIKIENKYNSGLKPESKLICKDYLVSGESFEISEFEKGIFKTEPVPENLSRYYESEDYISHSDSKKNFREKIYQLVKSYMLSKKAGWIQNFKRQGKILDYGAGTGDFLNKMKSLDWKVEGIEPNNDARKLAVLKGLNLKSDLSDLGSDQYDVISLWHVLEHIPDFEKKLVRFHKLLKEDGLLIIAVPNYNSYDAHHYNKNWAAWDVPRHLWHFSRTGLESKLVEYGFNLVKENPLKFDSYYVSLLSEKSGSKISNLLNALYTGFISNFKAKQSGEYSSLAYFFRKGA